MEMLVWKNTLLLLGLYDFEQLLFFTCWVIDQNNICDAIKQNESEVEKYDFCHFLLGYYLGFNLVKTPQRLGNWFQRYKQLKDWTNNKKQKKLSALFSCIFKKVFASSILLLLDHITFWRFWSITLGDTAPLTRNKHVFVLYLKNVNTFLKSDICIFKYKELKK